MSSLQRPSYRPALRPIYRGALTWGTVLALNFALATVHYAHVGAARRDVERDVACELATITADAQHQAVASLTGTGTTSSGEISGSITGTVNNWSPPSSDTIISVRGDEYGELEGLRADRDGRVLYLLNTGDKPIVVVPESTHQEATDRIATTVDGRRLEIPPGATQGFMYLASWKRWAVLP